MSEEQMWYYFTFGVGQPNAGHYVKFFGTYEGTRKKMFEEYGNIWAFQYSEDEWKAWTERCEREGMTWMVEKGLMQK